MFVELAFQLLQKQARLVLWDIREDDLNTTKNDLLSTFPEATVITQVVDLRDDEAMETAAQELAKFCPFHFFHFSIFFIFCVVFIGKASLFQFLLTMQVWYLVIL